MVRRSSWFVLVLLLTAVGCTSTTYGTRRHVVRLETDPPGATAYLQRFTDWERSEGPRLLDEYYQAASPSAVRHAVNRLLGLIERHRVAERPTPVDVNLVAHEHIFIALLDDMLGVTIFLPRPQGRVRPFITLSRHPALSPE